MTNIIIDDIIDFIGAEECDECNGVDFHISYERGYFVNIKDEIVENGLNVIKRIVCRKCKKEWVDEE